MSTNIINEAFINACRDGNLQEVKRWLTAGADVNAKIDETPLTMSAGGGHVEVVQFLLDKGANIDGTNNIG